MNIAIALKSRVCGTTTARSNGSFHGRHIL
jgi:hypothetical protein